VALPSRGHPEPDLDRILEQFPEISRERLMELLTALDNRDSSPEGRGKPCILRVDGASRGNPGPAASAGILETPDGKPVAEIGRKLGWATNNYAEYSALLIGLEAAHEKGFSSVEVRSDSQLMVRQMTGEYKVKHPDIIKLKEQADRLVSLFQSVSFHHVPREQNTAADALCNRVLDGTFKPF
jgi:ribonuclease HI